MLKERNLRLATAESCTGGYIAHLITSIAGSSEYYLGSVIAYSNEVKENVLGVSPETIAAHGAVSEATVTAMAHGTLKTIKADIALAISGIAGPGGGGTDKPVGTAWMAVTDGHQTVTFKLQAGKDRLKNIQYFSVHALNLVRKFLLGMN
jgi:nicotinamide-nucleotide amidase